MKKKPEKIDLGLLQKHYEYCRSRKAATSAALARALEAEERAKSALESAKEQLQSASRAVLS